MRHYLLISAAALALSAGVAFAAPDQPGHESPKPGTNSEPVSATEDAVGGAVGVISAEMTTTTQGFVTAAATSDMYEVEAGKIALQRTHSAKIKHFAQMMIDAHTKTTAELKAALGNASVTIPAHLDDRRQGMIDNLRGATDADFDVRYLNQQTNAHQEAAILMRGYAKDGDNAAVRKFAAKTLPAVEKHLAEAKKLDTADEDLKGAKS